MFIYKYVLIQYSPMVMIKLTQVEMKTHVPACLAFSNRDVLL